MENGKDKVSAANKYYEESERLHRFFRGKIEVVSKCTVDELNDFSLWYTPGVAEPCREIARDPSALPLYTNHGNAVAVVSDGTRVLGLGNIGARAAMPVMEGKALLFKYLGGVDAYPLCLDTTDVETLVTVCKAITPTFGGINLEDVETPKCFHLLKRLQEELPIPVWHDDRQGTATVILAGIFSSLKLKGIALGDARIVLFGAGASNLAVADLLELSGADVERIILVDSRGIITRDRVIPADNPIKAKWARLSNGEQRTGGIREALAGADLLVALSTPGPGVILPDDIRVMAKDPAVFVCANPVPEIWPWEAQEAGAAIVATGRSDFPNQLNNSIVFPGVFRGALDVGTTSITDEMCVDAALAITARAEELGLSATRIVPTMEDEKVFAMVARAVGLKAIERGFATIQRTGDELLEMATTRIHRARTQVQVLMDAGVIPHAPR